MNIGWDFHNPHCSKHWWSGSSTFQKLIIWSNSWETTGFWWVWAHHPCYIWSKLYEGAVIPLWIASLLMVRYKARRYQTTKPQDHYGKSPPAANWNVSPTLGHTYSSTWEGFANNSLYPTKTEWKNHPAEFSEHLGKAAESKDYFSLVTNLTKMEHHVSNQKNIYMRYTVYMYESSGNKVTLRCYNIF